MFLLECGSRWGISLRACSMASEFWHRVRFHCVVEYLSFQVQDGMGMQVQAQRVGSACQREQQRHCC